MPFSVEQVPNQPIFVITLSEPFDQAKEAPASDWKFQELIATVQGTIYRVIDLTRWTIPFNDMINGLASDTRGGAGADPRIHTVIVGSGEMVEFGVKAMKQRQYGAKEIPLFASLDEALAYVNAELAKA